MTRTFTDAAALAALIAAHPMCAVYFSAPGCAVCHALRPKLAGRLAQDFPAIAFAEVDAARSPGLAAAHGVFTVPTLIVFALGKEQLRHSHSFGIAALADELERPYALLYSDRPGAS